jgi:hypothetical protein
MSTERRIWQHPQIIITLLLVFVAGAVSGALVHNQIHQRTSAATKEPTTQAVVQHFKSELGLTPEQASKISVVLEDFSHYYESIQEQQADLMRQQADLRATGKGRIIEILNPEQRVKFEKMMGQLAPQLAK